MTTRLKASLEAAIQAWADSECESDDWQQAQAYWPDSLVPHMATAAYIVMLVNKDAQKFAKEQEG